MKSSIPPQLPLRFFRWFCHPKLRDSIEGDLMELYAERKTKNGKLKADVRFIIDVLLLLRPGMIRSTEGYKNLNNYEMLKSYLKIGFRNLVKHKLFTVINISGMAISIGSFLIISLFIYDELQFDRQVKDVHLKYRVYNDLIGDDGSIRKAAMVPPPIGPALAAEFPEVETYFRFMNFNNPILFKVGDKKMTEAKGGYADPSVFDMFSLHLLEGDPATALTEPNTIAINHTLKQKYFGSKPALGESIEIFNKPFKVNAVFEDFGAHSHLQLNYFISIEYAIAQNPGRMQNWGWSQFHTYIKLKPGADAAKLETSLKEFAARNVLSRGEDQYLPHLMPMKDIHLYASDHVWDIAVRGNAQTVYILLATAVFILIIAILNFVNLSTARAVSRVKEVGLRKVVGAFRSQLIYQFVSESMIVAFVALLAGVLATELILPSLNAFTEKNIPADFFFDPFVILALILFAIFIGIAAGAYPAFYISGYKPAQILTNKQSGKSGKTLLRKGLVVLQFILSFFLIIAALTVTQQHTFMRTSDMGFDKNNLIVVRLRGDMTLNSEATKQTFLNHPNIISGTLGYGLPGEAYAGDGIRDKQNENKDKSCSMLTVDHDYIKTLGLELVAGRDFSMALPSDEKNAFILSEAAAKMLGYADPNDALGHELAWPRWDAPDSLKEGKVIGVVKDIQLNSMRENILPVVLHVYPFAYSSLTLRIKSEDVPATIEHLEKNWKTYNSEWPFEYKFLDENFDKMYKSEEKLATLFTSFTTFTIFVACLGLFGLVVYSTTQKYKEISIRKVLGAKEGSLVMQLSKSYLVLIAIAFIIAVPLSYYAADEWLQKFAFRIPITPMLFIKAGLLIMAISLVTVGIQSIKAARANPVNALKEQ